MVKKGTFNLDTKEGIEALFKHAETPMTLDKVKDEDDFALFLIQRMAKDKEHLRLAWDVATNPTKENKEKFEKRDLELRKIVLNEIKEWKDKQKKS